jgi:hypothetical protein
MRKQIAFEPDQHEVEENVEVAGSFPDGYRIAQSRGYYYPQKQVGDAWLYFPANGPLLLEEIAKAMWFRKYARAKNYLKRSIASEQAAWQSGLFDGTPTLNVYHYPDLAEAIVSVR